MGRLLCDFRPFNTRGNFCLATESIATLGSDISTCAETAQLNAETPMVIQQL